MPPPDDNETQTLPARTGVAILLRHNQTIKILNTHGKQVVDFWAIVPRSSTPEYMSMSHTRTSTLSLCPRPGTTLLTNLRRPVLEMIADTSPGVHDTQIAACDPTRYQQLGVEGPHASCAENFHLALQKISDLKVPDTWIRTCWCPDPLNLFMNIPFSNTTVRPVQESTPPTESQNDSNQTTGHQIPANHLSLSWSTPVSQKGDSVTFKALRDECLVVMSACPQDLLKINDSDKGPMDVEYVIGWGLEDYRTHEEVEGR